MVWKLIQDIAGHMIPWQQRIKDIESHFGSVVSSYFVFLRWIFWMNFAITLILTFTVILPEVSFCLAILDAIVGLAIYRSLVIYGHQEILIFCFRL